MNDLVALRGPVEAVPEVGLLPLQPPEAVQEVALNVDQDKVDDPLGPTVVGFAVKLTVMVFQLALVVTESEAVPPGPVQVRVQVAEAAVLV